MIVLPDTLLSSMRTAAESLMTDTCTIEVKTSAVGEMGEVLPDVYSLVDSAVPCRMITQSSVTTMDNEPMMVGGRDAMAEQYRLVCPYDTALAVDQRVTLDSDGSTWFIIDLITARTSNVDNQAMVVRING